MSFCPFNDLIFITLPAKIQGVVYKAVPFELSRYTFTSNIKIT